MDKIRPMKSNSSSSLPESSSFDNESRSDGSGFKNPLSSSSNSKVELASHRPLSIKSSNAASFHLAPS